MNLYELLCVTAAMLIIVMSLARLNDIGRDKKAMRWWFRRIGLLMSFTGMVLFVGSHFLTFAPYWRQIMAVLSLWGWAIVGITTPGQQPFWKYISRNDAPLEGEQPRRRKGDM